MSINNLKQLEQQEQSKLRGWLTSAMCYKYWGRVFLGIVLALIVFGIWIGRR